MNRMPGAMVVVDAKKEYIALREARKLGIPTIALMDTDSDPDTVDVAIPGNDDSIKAIEILMDQLATAIAEGKTMVRQEDVTTMGATRTQRARTSRRRVLASAQEEEPQNEEPSVKVSIPVAPEAPIAPETPDASEVTETSEASTQ
jgi:small subunit ribosomal protein S2